MTDSRLIVPELLTQSERDEIVKNFKFISCDENIKTNHFDCVLPGRPPLFVKFSDSDLLNEASTQFFFYTLSRGDSSAPRIPAVYDAFRGPGGYFHFFVMEKMDMPTLESCGIPEDDAAQIVAPAVGWLLAQMPFVPNTIFGRISAHSQSACVWHRFFKEQQAPAPFVSPEALSKYINKAFSRRPRKAPTLSVSLTNDLCIYHSDIYPHNFLFDITTRQVCIIDFQHIGVLPKPFQTYSFFNADSFPAKVGKYLGHEPSAIADMMMGASALLQQMGGTAHLGLNKFGERPPKVDPPELGKITVTVFRPELMDVETSIC